MDKRMREHLEWRTTKEEAPPRVISPDLNSLSSVPTNARILTQEVLTGRPLFRDGVMLECGQRLRVFTLSHIHSLDLGQRNTCKLAFAYAPTHPPQQQQF